MPPSWERGRRRGLLKGLAGHSPHTTKQPPQLSNTWGPPQPSLFS